METEDKDGRGIRRLSGFVSGPRLDALILKIVVAGISFQEELTLEALKSSSSLFVIS